MAINLMNATEETFEPFIGSAFVFETDFGRVELTLDNIKAFPSSTVRDNHLEIDGEVVPPRKAFALTFVGSREPVLPSSTYKVTHETTGTFDLFLSPFRQDHDCMLYESTFN